MSTPFYDLASLVVVPSGYKAGKVYAQKPQTTDGQLAFTRASTATRVNASGLIEAVATGVPRLDYLGSSCPKLNLEPQRSNLVQYSQEFDNGYWGQYLSTVTPNDIISPDGTQNADKIVSTSAPSINVIYRNNITGISAGRQTTSFFVKAGTTSIAYLQIYDGTTVFSSDYNLTTATTTATTAGATATITPYGNGWYRCTLSATTLAANHFLDFGIRTTAIGQYAYFYGAQFESLAVYASSYIPTTTAAVTRVADAASKTGISSLIGQTAGTIYAEWTATNANTSGRILAISDGGFTNRIAILEDSATIRLFISASSVVQADLTNLGSYTGTHKIAVAYANNDLKVYLDGVAVATATTLTVPACSATYLGTLEDGSNATALNGGIKQALLFKTRLTNAQLAELTAL